MSLAFSVVKIKGLYELQFVGSLSGFGSPTKCASFQDGEMMISNTSLNKKVR